MTRSLIGLCGYNHNPKDPRHSADRNPDGHYTQWENIFTDYNFIGFPWDSALQWKDAFRAWRNGYATTYGYAFNKLTKIAAKNFLETVCLDNKPDLIAHSLGTRVAGLIMNANPNSFRHVIFLNGAEGVDTMIPIIRKNYETKFLNVSVDTDDVLAKMGRWRAEGGCIGQKGLDPYLNNLENVFFDSPDDQRRMKLKHGWNIRGDNPDSVGDHAYSFKHEGNHDLLRYFLEHGMIN